MGGLTVRVVQGIVFGYVFGGAQDANPNSSQGIIVATLLLIVGILMLITAFRAWHKEEDPDAPPPKWMAAISGLSALKAFGMGALLVAIAAKQWVFTLSAIGTIGDAGLAQAADAVLFLFCAIAAQSLVLAPVLFYAAAPPSGQIVAGQQLQSGWNTTTVYCDRNIVDFWPVLDGRASAVCLVDDLGKRFRTVARHDQYVRSWP